MYIDNTEIESRARRIAAIKMGLVKDPDGLKLPDDLWRQCWDDAKAEAERDRLPGYTQYTGYRP